MKHILMVAAAAALVAGPAQAAEPCGGVRLDSGNVKTGKALPTKPDLACDDLACAKAVAAALKERAQIWRVNAVDAGEVVGIPSRTYSLTVK
ncbi:MAG: hypothetical protein FJ100_12005 [Deltaproteobacteria bacterium]|nr:hypothetical protein [Deltaproteobacteria bacterium]